MYDMYSGWFTRENKNCYINLIFFLIRGFAFLKIRSSICGVSLLLKYIVLYFFVCAIFMQFNYSVALFFSDSFLVGVESSPF